MLADIIDMAKYDTARRLHKIVDRIRSSYTADFKSKEMRVRQRAVAMYFIDKVLSTSYFSVTELTLPAV